MNPRLPFYWIIVAIPLCWGVAQSINSALPLFGGKSTYIPWVLGVPPPPAPKGSDATPAPSATPTPAASVPPNADTTVPAPGASPFSTAQPPSATVPPIVAPTPPTT